MRKRELLPGSRENAKKQVRIVASAVAVLVMCLFAASAMAVPPGKTVVFPDGAMGKVVFDGKIHADKDLKCNDCHTKIFPMKKGGTISMADINAGKFCGACHNGTKAFAAKDGANCKKCHKK